MTIRVLPSPVPRGRARRWRCLSVGLTAVVTAVAALPAAAFAQPAPTEAASVAIVGMPPGPPPGPPSAGVAPSVMFSLRDLLEIEAALREGGLDHEAGGGAAEEMKPRLREPLSLSGIVYGGVGDWTIWLNGQIVRPTSAKAPLFEVIEVTARQVMLLVAWGETTRQVILEPNQTFDPRRGEVVEGRGL